MLAAMRHRFQIFNRNIWFRIVIYLHLSQIAIICIFMCSNRLFINQLHKYTNFIYGVVAVFDLYQLHGLANCLLGSIRSSSFDNGCKPLAIVLKTFE